MKDKWNREVNALMLEGKRDEAERIIEEKSRVNPKSAQDYFDRGLALWRKGSLEAALGDFQECVNLVPDDYEANLRLGYTLSNLGRDEEALRVFEKVIELRADDPEGYRSRAQALFGLKRYEEALAYNEELLLRFPSLRGYWELGRAWALNQLGRHTEALDFLKSVKPSEIIPLPSYSYYLSLAGTLALLKRFDDALDALKKGMDETKAQKGCISCFVGNCWRSPYLEPLRKPPYRARLEVIIGPKPKVSKG